jgi:hypothetical protein
VIGLLRSRVRHAVFVACTVPADGQSAFETLEPEVQQRAREETGVLSSVLARSLFGNDLDDEQFAWCLERMVPEAPALVMEPVDLTPLRSAVERTWVRPLRDAIVGPDKQLRFAGHVDKCPVIDIDAGHMCMISKPRQLATIIDGIAGSEQVGDT